ncbi:TPA: hypothetical protein ACK8T7_003863 [Klebsiella aerogenes]
MNIEIIKASDIIEGEKIILGGNEVCDVVSITIEDFSQNERDYQFGSDSTHYFIESKKVSVDAMGEGGEEIRMIFASTDNVATLKRHPEQ